MKVSWRFFGLVASVFLGLFDSAGAPPHGGGFRESGSSRRFIGRAGPAFRMRSGIRRDFARNHRFRRGHPFTVVWWPAYWYPYYYPGYYPLDVSYLDYGSDYDYRDSTSTPMQSRYLAAAPTPVVVVINQGNARAADSPTAQQVNLNRGSIDAEAPGGTNLARSNLGTGKAGDSAATVDAAVKQAAQAAEQIGQKVPDVRAQRADKFVLVSWLKDGGKEVIYVQNTQSKEVEKVTSEPGLNHLRLVEVHPNADPKEFEAIISDGSEQLPVRFRF